MQGSYPRDADRPCPRGVAGTIPRMNANLDLPLLAVILIGIGVLVPLIYYGGYGVHRVLEVYCYVPYARRFCRKRGLQPVRWRCGMAFWGGMKTECSVVELNCLGGDGQEYVLELLVWIMGVRGVLKIEPPVPHVTFEVPCPSLIGRRTHIGIDVAGILLFSIGGATLIAHDPISLFGYGDLGFAAWFAYLLISDINKRKAS